MKLTPVVIDFETFWSNTHSLTHISPIVYVKHSYTEIISVAIKVGDGPTKVTFGQANIAVTLNEIDWSDKLAIAHNMSGFDAMILAWIFKIKPAMWGCTLAMARPLHAMSVGGSLAKLVEHYGLGAKDNSALIATKGKNLIHFTGAEMAAMAKYNMDDANQCRALFDILLPLTSKREMRLIDQTVRMLVEPKFVVDEELLITTLGTEKLRKRSELVKLAHALGLTEKYGVSNHIGTGDEEELLTVVNQLSGGVDAMVEEVREELASAPKYAARLISWGVEPPMKPSPTNPDKETYAFAKTDQEYVALQEHANPLVAAATRIRLDVKSTILETRIESFLEVSKAMGGVMPIAKNYYAAHTGRWGGSMGLNQENLTRIPRDTEGEIIPTPSNALRMCMKAPKGHKVVVADLSGIELRINHYLWKVPYSTELWNKDAGADLYRAAGAIEYHCGPDAVTKLQRQLEKVKALGLGFGSGAKTFKNVAKTLGKIDLSLSDAVDAVTAWRGKHLEIVQGWKRCHAALAAIHQGVRMDIDPWGLCYTSAEGIHTPCGVIRYPGLHQEAESEGGGVEWWYGTGRNRTRIYAGKVDENIVQHLARNKLADDVLLIKKNLGYNPVHLVHDEWIGIAPQHESITLLAGVQEIMRTPPVWWPQLVTWSEGDIADNYGSAK